MDEEEVKTDLSRWLESQASSTVYWAESPPEEFERFQFEGAEVRPDLLSVGDTTVVIEVKDGTDSGAVYDAMPQLHEYWQNYQFGNAGVVADGNEIEVDAFLIATQFATEGHLFKEEREQGYRKTYGNDEYWNKNSRPQYEWARTEAIPRVLWRYAWWEAENSENDNKKSIESGPGILLSSKLDSNPSDQSQSGFADFDSNSPPSSVPKALYYCGDSDSVWTKL